MSVDLTLLQLYEKILKIKWLHQLQIHQIQGSFFLNWWNCHFVTLSLCLEIIYFITSTEYGYLPNLLLNSVYLNENKFLFNVLYKYLILFLHYIICNLSIIWLNLFLDNKCIVFFAQLYKLDVKWSKQVRYGARK